MNESTRDEIERAIVRMEKDIYFLENYDGSRNAIECHELALSLLRAELNRQENAPLTWNERINQMTVEEKAVFFSELFNCATCPIIEECQHDCNTMLTKWLNSPYTEGATK